MRKRRNSHSSANRVSPTYSTRLDHDTHQNVPTTFHHHAASVSSVVTDIITTSPGGHEHHTHYGQELSIETKRDRRRSDGAKIVRKLKDSDAADSFSNRIVVVEEEMPQEQKQNKDRLEVRRIKNLIKYRELTFGEKMAKGSYGIVYKGKYAGREVAIKQMRKSFDKKDFSATDDDTIREISILQEIDHPHIIKLLGVCFKKRKEWALTESTDGGKDFKLYLVTKWVHGGNLSHIIATKELLEYGWRTRITLLLETASAVAYLHANSFMHRDIKSGNLLLSRKGHIKLCDFGFSRRKTPDGARTPVGTNNWMAPEVLMGNEYDEKCDVFSFGVVIYEVITCRGPLKRTPPDYVLPIDRIKPFVQKGCPAELQELAASCCKYEPQNRPTFVQIEQALTKIRGSIVADIPPSPPSKAERDRETRTLRETGVDFEEEDEGYNSEADGVDFVYL